MIEIVEPGFEIKGNLEGIEEHIEWCGRECYQSSDKIKPGSAEPFVRGLIKRGHLSVLEHSVITAKIICSRSCSHQLVRHRIAAYSQESQRFCDYGKKGLRVICPSTTGLSPGQYMAEDTDQGWRVWKHLPVGWEYQALTPRQRFWIANVDCCYDEYKAQRKDGIPAGDARYLLPNACKTSVVSTFNMRMWRHVFQERGLNKHAQWEIRGIFKGILDEFAEQMPSLFGDLIDE